MIIGSCLSQRKCVGKEEIGKKRGWERGLQFVGTGLPLPLLTLQRKGRGTPGLWVLSSSNPRTEYDPGHSDTPPTLSRTFQSSIGTEPHCNSSFSTLPTPYLDTKHNPSLKTRVPSHPFPLLFLPPFLVPILYTDGPGRMENLL